ncbi:MAG TPA: SatD family protein [Gemmatimonadales bacterium]|nr:SatD family protein [Gemmatimonadales bacterium]
MSKLYVALIADAVASRALAPPRRARLQADLRAALGDFNRRYRRALAARFGITQGDELQCLLSGAGPVWDVAHAIRARFATVDWVIGCGRGTVTTPLTSRVAAPEVDGPCFHEARAAIEAAKRDRQLFAFRGFGAADATLNGCASYYSALYWSWTRRQREAAATWRFTWSPGEAALSPAARLKVVPSAVSHLRRRMAWPLVDAGDKMFRAILEGETA